MQPETPSRWDCSIPQPSEAGQPKNVISGRFTTAAGTDWAVLCARDRRAVILVFRGGRSNQVDELAEDADSQYLQVMTGSEIRYSRLLAVRGKGVGGLVLVRRKVDPAFGNGLTLVVATTARRRRVNRRQFSGITSGAR